MSAAASIGDDRLSISWPVWPAQFGGCLYLMIRVRTGKINIIGTWMVIAGCVVADAHTESDLRR